MVKSSINRRDALKLSMLGASSLGCASLSAFAATLMSVPASRSSPSAVEKVAAALARLDALVKDEMTSSGIPRVGIAIVYKDKSNEGVFTRVPEKK